MEKSVNQDCETFSLLTIPLEALQGYIEPLTVTQNVLIKNFAQDGIELLNGTGSMQSGNSESYIIESVNKRKNNNIYNQDHIVVKSIVKNNKTNQDEVRYLKCKVAKPMLRTPNVKRKPKPDGPKKCPICEASFEKITQYRQHMQEHRNMKKYKCDKCNESYNVESNFKVHSAMHLKGEPMCPICDRKFQRLASLKSHLIVHQVEETVSCHECLAEFDKEEELNEHLQVHKKEVVNVNVKHSEIPFVCSYCDYLFHDAEKYKEHIALHMKAKKMVKHRMKRRTILSREYPHKCDECTKSFSKLCLLERHKRIHTGEKPYVCHICNSCFSQKGTLHIHLNKHNGKKPFECMFCSARFSQKGNLRVHLDKTHTAGQPGEKVYKCTHCTCIFKKVSSLNGHVTRVHKTTLKEGNISVLMDQLKDLNKQCAPIITTTKHGTTITIEKDNNSLGEENLVKLAEASLDGTIRRYVVRQREVGDIRWYICSFCNKEFKKPSDLIRHIRIHTKERPFQCMDCGQKFSHKSTLKNHSAVHTKRNYECDICYKRFTSVRVLNAHLRKHTAKRPVQQPPEAKLDVTVVMKQPMMETENGVFPVPAPKPKIPFATMEEYKDRPFKCKHCQAVFLKNVHLKRHMSTHTGIKEFSCELCNKQFSTSYGVKEHMNYHTKTKNYECKQCKKKFYTNSILKRHTMSHAAQKPYICPYCKKRFKLPLFCRKHIKQLHQKELEDSLLAMSETGELSYDPKIIDLSDAISDDAFSDINLINSSGIEDIMPPMQTYNNLSTVNDKIINKESFTITEACKVLEEERLALAKQAEEAQMPPPPPTPPPPPPPEPPQKEPSSYIDVSQLSMENIYITSEDLQMLSTSNVNSWLPQLKLENTDPLLLSSINELQENNILYPLDPSQGDTDPDYPNDGQNYDTFNPSLVFNTAITDLPQNMIITNDRDHSDKNYTNEQIDLELNQIATQKVDNTMVDNLIILNNDVHKPEINYFNINLNDYTDINALNLPANASIGKVMQPMESDEIIMCSICKSTFTKVDELHGHVCILPVSESLNCDVDIHQSHPDIEEIEAEPEVSIEISQRKRKTQVKPTPPNEKFSCVHCEKEFQFKSAMLRHVSAKHKETINNTCTYCEKKFKKRSDLERHLRTHTGEKPFPCDKCEKKFSLKSTLMSHYRTHNPVVNKDFKCLVCNAFFSCKSSLKAHTLIHSDKKDFCCEYCSVKFRTAHHRKNHMVKCKVKNKTYKTSKITLQNLQSLLLENHLNQPQEIIMHEPVYEQETPENQELQQATQNLIAAELPNISEGLNLSEPIQIDPILLQLQSTGLELQLEIDGQIINLKPNFNVEILNDETINVVDDVPEVIERPVRDKKDQCDMCFKFYVSKSVLNKHKRLMHGKYKCHKCDKAFDDKNMLDVHVRLHYGYRPYNCTKCTNSFAEEASLKTHLIRIHRVNSETNATS